MSITATVQDGKIILPLDVQWPSGTAVRVEMLPAANLGEMLAEFDGIVDDLPGNLASNLDHCVHGHREHQASNARSAMLRSRP